MASGLLPIVRCFLHPKPSNIAHYLQDVLTYPTCKINLLQSYLPWQHPNMSYLPFQHTLTCTA